MSTTKKKYVVIGSTSEVGRVVAAKLSAQGHHVSPVARSLGILIDDRKALTEAFKDADGAYLMIPFDMTAPDLHHREVEIGANLAEALEKHHVRRIVLLSGLNAYLKFGSSLGAALMEDRLNALNIPELVHLRCGWFMENFFKGMGFMQQAASGVFSTAFRGDIATPMISARDIGEIAAGILLEEPFAQPRVRELLGPRDYTMGEAMHILGKTIGKPDLVYMQSSYDDAQRAMIGAGVSPSFAEAVIETAKSFNNGQRWALEERSAQNTTSTTLEYFARVTVRNINFAGRPTPPSH
jgi:uncharacterized protein YbjT (DUF2867 family)